MPSAPQSAPAGPDRRPPKPANSDPGWTRIDTPPAPRPGEPLSGIPTATAATGTRAISVPSFTRFAKFCVGAVIVLCIGYFTVRNAYPFLLELAKPGGTAGANDTPASVRMLQQTRAVVAKNDANVARVNALIAESFGADGVALAAALPELPPQPAPPRPRRAPVIVVRTEPLKNLVIDDLHVSGVISGKNPRIIIGDLMVGVGGMVDFKRRIRFLALDETRRVIVLGNDAGTVERSY